MGEPASPYHVCDDAGEQQALLVFVRALLCVLVSSVGTYYGADLTIRSRLSFPHDNIVKRGVKCWWRWLRDTRGK